VELPSLDELAEVATTIYMRSIYSVDNSPSRVAESFVKGVFASGFDLQAPFNVDVEAIHCDATGTAVAEFAMSALAKSGSAYENNYCRVFTVRDGLM
jgi:ketosteroid isomerase-like protein